MKECGVHLRDGVKTGWKESVWKIIVMQPNRVRKKCLHYLIAVFPITFLTNPGGGYSYKRGYAYARTTRVWFLPISVLERVGFGPFCKTIFSRTNPLTGSESCQPRILHILPVSYSGLLVAFGKIKHFLKASFFENKAPLKHFLKA